MSETEIHKNCSKDFLIHLIFSNSISGENKDLWVRTFNVTDDVLGWL